MISSSCKKIFHASGASVVIEIVLQLTESLYFVGGSLNGVFVKIALLEDVRVNFNWFGVSLVFDEPFGFVDFC